MSREGGEWEPGQYERFRAERAQPFRDLAALVERAPGMRIVDLGCGTGQLTAWLHDELRASQTLGVDVSESMLAEAEPRAREGLRFARGEIATFEAERPFDLVFSNAALQWVDGHEALWPRLAACLAPGGQLAVQVPVNHDHPSQRVLREVAARPRFANRLDRQTRPFPVLAPERYAELLHGLVLVRWLEDSARQSLRPLTFVTYEGIVRLQLQPVFGGIELDRLTPQHVQGLLNERLAAAWLRRPYGTFRECCTGCLRLPSGAASWCAMLRRWLTGLASRGGTWTCCRPKRRVRSWTR